MAIASVATLLDLLRQIPLLETEQMEELARLSRGNYADARGLAGELVRRGWLTPYQVNQLFQGRGLQLILGSFVLLERLGEGGMGQVFKARHRKLGRIVALKLIRQERLAHPDIIRRFRREIEAASKLTHPNIVLALDADEIDNLHFFVMEYVEGIDLAKYVKQRGPLPVELACGYVRQAALGLQHAYERGMVHRDIKPHNLLLATQTGTIKLLDMGLARLQSEEQGGLSGTSSLTAEGAVMGTPDYIAPEQARDARSADIRADLYSLGCTFYYLLTGQVPFPKGTAMEKLILHQTEPPRALSAYRPDVPPTVVALVNRLLAKRPAERFQTPVELIAALDAVESPSVAAAALPAVALPDGSDSLSETLPMPSNAPLQAPFGAVRGDTIDMYGNKRPAGASLPRSRAWLYSAVGGSALLLLIFLIFLLFKDGGNEKGEVAPTASQEVESASPDAVEKEWKALRARGMAAGADGSKVRDELIAFRRKHGGSRSAREAAEWMMRLSSPLDRWTVNPLSPLQKLDGQPKELLAVLGDHRSWLGPMNRPFVQYSSDGRWLACTAADGTIRLLNPDDLTVKAILKSDEPQQAFDFRRDGKMLATSGRTSVVLWDLSGQQPRQVRVIRGFPWGIGWVALSADGKRLAVPCGTEPPTVRLWDISSESKEVSVLQGHTSYLCKPAFSPDGKKLATGSQDKTIRIWDLSGDQPKEQAVLKDHTYWVVSVEFSPDGKLLASCGQHDCTLRLWDMTGPEPKELTGGPWLGEATNDAMFSHDGKRLACGFWGGHWRLWDVAERQLRQIAFIPDHSANCIVWSAAFSPNDQTVATMGNDGVVHLWQIKDMPPRQRFVSPGHGQPITGLAFTPDDGTLVSMSRDGTVRLWDMKAPSDRERVALPVQLGHVCGAVHPDGRTLVTGDSSEKRVLWDIASGKEIRSVTGRIWHAVYRSDGKMLIGTSEGHTIAFWDADSGEVKRIERVEPKAALRDLAISPDGRRVAASDIHGILHLWHTGDPREHRTCKAPEGCSSVLAFRADSKILAAGGKDGRLRLFEVANGRERTSYPAHEGEVSFVAFTPDGKQLISCGADGLVIVRDSNNGRELRNMKMLVPITAAHLAGDGRHLAVGHVDGAISMLRLADPP